MGDVSDEETREEPHQIGAHSLARGGSEKQLEDSSSILIADPPAEDPTAHVVLFQPQIPQNTGNISRSCVATGAVLWIVRPMAFRLDERAVRRAGLDYWKFLDLRLVDSWGELCERLPMGPTAPTGPTAGPTPAPTGPGRRYWFFSRFATRSLYQGEFSRGDVLVFGSETEGLPDSIRQANADQLLRLPMTERVRSLNLSNTVAVALYELIRQSGTAGRASGG